MHLIPVCDFVKSKWCTTQYMYPNYTFATCVIVAQTRRDTRTSENQQTFFKITKRFFVICVSWLNFHLCRVNMVPHLFQWCYKFIWFNNFKNNNYKYETLLVRGCAKVIIFPRNNFLFHRWKKLRCENTIFSYIESIHTRYKYGCKFDS